MTCDDTQRRIGRRALIKWGLAAGAALGVPRWKVFEVLEDSGGAALAQDAACVPVNRSIHLIAGTGALSWFHLLWPHNDVAAARNETFSWHAIGEERLFEGTDKPLTYGPDTPLVEFNASRQVTAFVAGTPEIHSRTPEITTDVAMGTGVFAAAAAIQSTNPTLTPVIAVGDAPYRTASGAPQVARVGRATDIVALFNSAASRAGGLLSNRNNAELYASSYSAWMSLRAAASSPTMRSGIAAGTTSARLLGTNLADALRVTDADLERYGARDARSRLREFARTLIVTAKAFINGLTSSVIVPVLHDDPHGAFADMPGTMATARTLKTSIDAFYADLAVADPTCAGTTIAENTVMTVHGDTPKDPLIRTNWPDSTPNNISWVYVMGAGHLKSGWFGGVNRDGTTRGWNPTTGEDVPITDASPLARPASAAVLYAIARGDMRRVNDFYRGEDIGGVIRSATI